MNYHEQYVSKKITVQEAVGMIQNNSYLYSIGASSPPIRFFEELERQVERFENLKIVDMLPVFNTQYYKDAAFSGKVQMEIGFFLDFVWSLKK